MLTPKQIKQLEVSEYEISLRKLIGKPIADIYGRITGTGEDAVFQMTRVRFRDGTFLSAEGEHDCPYLVEFDVQPNYNTEVLQSLALQMQDGHD
jgi:hypothetical protein